MKRLILAILAASFAAGCATGRNEMLAAKLDRKSLRIGVETSFKPFIFRQDGRISGIEADFAREIGRLTGAEIQFVETKWEDLIPNLCEKKIDVIMSGMTVTEERSKKISFCSPYIVAGQMAVLRTTDIAEFSTGLKVIQTKKRIGFVKDTTGNFFVASRCVNAGKIPFDTPQQGINALLNGGIDVFIVDAPVTWALTNTRLTTLCEPLTHEPIAWAVNTEDKILKEVLDKSLNILKVDGTAMRIERKWIPEVLLNQIY